MSNETSIIWSKESKVSRSFGFQFSPKLKGILKRKGLWSPDASAEIGDRKLRFQSSGKANMHLKVYEGNADEVVGELHFYWKDFQKCDLTLSSGKVFQLKATELLRGVWSWFKKGGSVEQVTYRVDNPFHRSGTLENNITDLSAQERDILLLLGLNLQHYINTWLMTIAAIVIVVVTGS